jgi:hypothetical protein
MPEKKTKSFLSVSSGIAVLVECEYAERDGLSYYQSGITLKGRPVRRVRGKELRTRALLEKIAGGTPGWIDFLTGIKKLQQIENAADDPRVFADAYKLMAAELGFDPKKEPKSTFYSMLMPALVHALDGLRVVFWRTNDGQLLPGLFAIAPDNMKTAAAACWLLSPELRICNHCDRIFIAKRPKQTAHNAKCRDAHRLIRFRSKRKVAA